MEDTILALAVENNIIIRTMYNQIVNEWIPQVKEIAVCLDFSVVDVYVSNLLKKERPSFSYGQTIWIKPNVFEYVVKASMMEYDFVVKAFGEDVIIYT